ncbi:S49 family peptidase [Teichococcus aestuarii]|uniref:S49 family peptidase n=1 Tax=Teichococcus aestuarii TaxID=568898 RepID=UPI0036159244
MSQALLAAIRAQPWAILPEYMEAIEAVAVRFLEAPSLEALRVDGHAERHEANLQAIAAMGSPLEGTRRGMIRNGVASLPLFGPIFPRAASMSLSSGGTSLDTWAADFRAAERSEAVNQILLVVDSPGGVVSSELGAACELIASARKPVTAYVAGAGASAAYWMISQAGEIVMDPLSVVGSIGVLSSLSRQEGPDASGRRTHDVVSSNAENKRPNPATPEGRQVIQALVDSLEREFVATVAAGRKTTRETVLEDFGRGGLLAGKAAVKAGMADRLDSLEATLARLSRPAAPAGGSRALAEREHDMRQRRARSL